MTRIVPNDCKQVEGDKTRDTEMKFSSFRESWKEVIMARIMIGHTRFTQIFNRKK